MARVKKAEYELKKRSTSLKDAARVEKTGYELLLDLNGSPHKCFKSLARVFKPRYE